MSATDQVIGQKSQPWTSSTEDMFYLQTSQANRAVFCRNPTQSWNHHYFVICINQARGNHRRLHWARNRQLFRFSRSLSHYSGVCPRLRLLAASGAGSSDPISSVGMATITSSGKKMPPLSPPPATLSASQSSFLPLLPWERDTGSLPTTSGPFARYTSMSRVLEFWYVLEFWFFLKGV